MAKNKEGVTADYQRVLAQMLESRKKEELEGDVMCGKEFAMLMIWMAAKGLLDVELAPQKIADWLAGRADATKEVFPFFENVKAALDKGALDSWDIAGNLEWLQCARRNNELWVRFHWRTLDFAALQGRAQE